MDLQSGCFLKATSLLNDSIFENTTIFITEYNKKGTVGCIVNQPFKRNLNHLKEFAYVPDFPIYTGGPVATEYLFFIHQAPEIINGGKHIKDCVYVSGHFQDAITAICKQQIDQNSLKIFIGYCGWDAEQLESEIEEGCWIVHHDHPIFAFE